MKMYLFFLYNGGKTLIYAKLCVWERLKVLWQCNARVVIMQLYVILFILNIGTKIALTLNNLAYV